MIQSEQPYYQPTPAPPAPFESALGVFKGDPAFRCTAEEPCDSGWGLRVVDSRDITILGAGLYSWFSTYAQDCLATSSCQKTMADVSGNLGDIVIHNLVTIGAVNMLRSDKQLITAKDNQAVDFHPFWSQVSSFGAREFKPASTAEPIVEHGDGLDPTEAAQADLSSVCTMADTCVDPKDKTQATCGSGYTLLGYAYNNCWWGKAKMICCKTSSAPSSCMWRANSGSLSSDCDARCNEGEVPLYEDQLGGGLIAEDVECERGGKAFCCKHRGFSALTAGCAWERNPSCVPSGKCPEGKTFVAYKSLGSSGLGCTHHENYCCPRKQLDNCHWVGQGDCADVSCNNKEITLAIDEYGDSSSSCNWQRKKSLCCTRNLKAPEGTCAPHVCKAQPWECGRDPWALDGDEDELVEARDHHLHEESDDHHLAIRTNPNDPGRPSGKRRDFEVSILVLGVLHQIFLYSRTYTGPSGSYGRSTGARPGTNSNGIRLGGVARYGCSNIESFNINTELTGTGQRPNPDTRYDGYQMDHRVDLQYMRDLVHAVVHGVLTSGGDLSSSVSAIEYSTFEPYWNWNNDLLPIGMRQITPTSPKNVNSGVNSMRNVNNRLFEVLGGNTNSGTLFLLESELNRVKGALFNGVFDAATGKRTGKVDARDKKKMGDQMNALISTTGTLATQQRFQQDLEAVVAVWRYIRRDDVYSGIQSIRRALRNEITLVENETRQIALRPSLAGFTAIFDEFDPDWWERAADDSRSWILDWQTQALEALRNFEHSHGESHDEAIWIRQMLDDIWKSALEWIKRPDDL